jgi:hypothetical protein
LSRKAARKSEEVYCPPEIIRMAKAGEFGEYLYRNRYGNLVKLKHINDFGVVTILQRMEKFKGRDHVWWRIIRDEGMLRGIIDEDGKIKGEFEERLARKRKVAATEDDDFVHEE